MAQSKRSPLSAPADAGDAGDAGDLFDPTTVLGRDLAAVDWAATPLGPVAQWPVTLRSIVRLQLGSRFAMWMAWGPDLTFLCNEAYRGTLGAKYPWALGRPAAEVWSEIWPDIGPRIESVISTGVATWDQELLLFLERSGYPEETYHTFSYSPITDDAGVIQGMLCVVSEETPRAIGERRMATLRDLAAALAGASTTEEVCAAAGRQLAAAGRDLPFCLGYLFEADGSHGADRADGADGADGAEVARAWTANVPDDHPLARSDVRSGSDLPWPVETLSTTDSLVVELPARYRPAPTGSWDTPPTQAVIVPFAPTGQVRPFGFLVAGVSPFRELDEDYLGFVELVAGQVGAAIIRAESFEQQRQRAETLAELDRAKTAFFTNISHELRTPLTLLLGPTADALEDAGDPLSDSQRGRLEVVSRNAERLLKLVNTLLDFSRLESSQGQGRFEPVDLARYTSELAAMFDSVMHRAGLALTIDCGPTSEPAWVDREMWAKIVLNLVSNALKATFAGGIEVRLVERDGHAELSVTDSGVGIAPAEQTRLFERFHRVAGAKLRSHEGTGIGLALVAELAALHGGTVSVDSAVGEGSTFTVRVPLGAAHLPAERLAREPDSGDAPLAAYGAGYLAEASRWLGADAGADSDDRGEPGDADDADDARQSGDAPRVLVVDDNADMRDYIRDLLTRSYQVQTAVDGEDALRVAAETSPDLVLTDVMMPNLDGFGLLARLRDDPALMHVPVIMLSARSGDEATVEGLDAGADDYLVKPFSGRELLARVRANLELDRVRRVAEEIARSRELLDQAEELAHVGSWELDLRDNSVIASPEYRRILGITEDALDAGGLAAAMQSVADDARSSIRAAIDQTARDGTRLHLEHRLVRPDGGERLVRAYGVFRRTPGNDVGFIRGSIQDITEQRNAEAAVAASAAAREALAREHAIAEELQRSLLPATAFRVADLDIATYYAAGVEGTQAGGDWYDVIDLGGSRTALVIGDVMGRGVRAAAVMGQLRATVQAYARLDLAPEILMAHLDAAVRTMTDSLIVTCVYAVHDAERQTLTYANAGHLPPLLTPAGAATQWLEVGDPPLGTGHYQGSVETVAFRHGDGLTLYTDGLVEHRGSDLSAGISRFAELLDAHRGPVEALPSLIAAALLPPAPDDDVAILIAAARPREQGPLALSLPSVETSVEAARRAVSTALEDAGVDEEVRCDALLLVSELVTNAIRHGSPPVELRVRCDDACLIITVSDGSTAAPAPRPLDPHTLGGRGLALVDLLTADWGSHPTGSGKTVWCVIPLPHRLA